MPVPFERLRRLLACVWQAPNVWPKVDLRLARVPEACRSALGISAFIAATRPSCRTYALNDMRPARRRLASLVCTAGGS